jgi:hypothetical protein
MNPSPAPQVTEVDSFVSAQDLLELAKFSGGPQYDLVSFYFSLSSTSNGSHRQELLMVKGLVHDALRGISKTSPLASDLRALLLTAQEIRKAPSRLRVVFSCKSRNYRREFELSAHGSVSYLHIGRSFHLVPLLRAMDSCLPYCVVLIERGKARGFVVHGTEIHEVPDRFPTRGLGLRGDDSRLGWSHHIAGNRDDHRKAYFNELVPELHKFLSEHGSRLLVVGCREDLWGEMAPRLPSSEWSSQVIGRFDPTRFEVSPSDVFQASRPIFEQHLQRHYLKLWAEVDGTTQCVVGLDEIVQVLEQGRVQKLILGKPSDQMMVECSRCGHLQTSDDPCQYCNNPLMLAVRTQEALIQRSLLTDAEIAIPPFELSNARTGAAALLRG